MNIPDAYVRFAMDLQSMTLAHVVYAHLCTARNVEILIENGRTVSARTQMDYRDICEHELRNRQVPLFDC